MFEFAHARHGVADTPCLEVGERQVQQMAEQARTQLDVDSAGGMGEDIGADAGQH